MNSILSRLLLSALALSSLAYSAQANPIYVSKAGNNSNDGLTTATAKLTFGGTSGAIAAAPVNGTIIVLGDAAAYVENITINKNGITLLGPRAGQPASTWTPGPSDATLQGNAGVAITIPSSVSDVTIDGFVIQGISANSAINISQSGSPASNNITIRNNRINGGLNTTAQTNGIHMGGMTNGLIENNVIINGRNPIIAGIGLSTNTNALDDRFATNCVIRNNTIRMPGGGAFNFVGGMTRECLFLENTFEDGVPEAVNGALSVFNGNHRNGRFIRNRARNISNSLNQRSGFILLNPPNGTTQGTSGALIEENITNNIGYVAASFFQDATSASNTLRFNIAQSPSAASPFAILNDPAFVSFPGFGIVQAPSNWWFGNGPGATIPATMQAPANINSSNWIGEPGNPTNDGTTLTASITSTLTAGDGTLDAVLSITPTTSAQDIAILALDDTSTSAVKPGTGFYLARRIDRSYRFVTSLGNGLYLAQIRIPFSATELSDLNIEAGGVHVRKYDHVTQTWVLATSLNTTGTSNWLSQAPPTTNLGDYGVDVVNGFAWANVDHAGEFTAGDGDTLVPVVLSTMSAE